MIIKAYEQILAAFDHEIPTITKQLQDLVEKDPDDKMF